MDDVSGCEKLHFNNEYKSKMNGMQETRYVHAMQAQGLFDKIAEEAGGKGMLSWCLETE